MLGREEQVMGEIEEFLTELGVPEDKIPEVTRFLIYETTVLVDVKTDSLVEGISMGEALKNAREYIKLKIEWALNEGRNI